jgi:hypothetical protein
MKRYAYYISPEGQYTLEPNGEPEGSIACATQQQAEALIQHMAIMNPIVIIDDELPDN